MLEAYVDMREPDAGAQIDRYVANGWHIYSRGLIYTILRKEVDYDIQ